MYLFWCLHYLRLAQRFLSKIDVPFSFSSLLSCPLPLSSSLPISFSYHPPHFFPSPPFYNFHSQQDNPDLFILRLSHSSAYLVSFCRVQVFEYQHVICLLYLGFHYPYKYQSKLVGRYIVVDRWINVYGINKGQIIVMPLISIQIPLISCLCFSLFKTRNCLLTMPWLLLIFLVIYT